MRGCAGRRAFMYNRWHPSSLTVATWPLIGVEAGCRLLRAACRFPHVPRAGKPPSRVVVSQLMLALPRHVLGCLMLGQPAVPADATTVELTSAEIASSSCYDHVGKALCLLTALCELAFHHKQLRLATLASPDLAFALVDAANMCLLAVAGPQADALLQGAASTERVQTALDRAAMVPATFRALAFALTTHGNGSAAAAAAAGGVLDWGAICEAVLEVGGAACWSTVACPWLTMRQGSSPVDGACRLFCCSTHVAPHCWRRGLMRYASWF